MNVNNKNNNRKSINVNNKTSNKEPTRSELMFKQDILDAKEEKVELDVWLKNTWVNGHFPYVKEKIWTLCMDLRRWNT